MTSYATVGSLGRIEVGTMRLSERSLVLNSWTQSLVDALGHGLRSQSPHRGVYLASCGHAVELLVRAPHTTVLVARDAECAARAYGWIAGGYVRSRPALHWAFTKHDHRREGIARVLFAALQRELDGLHVYTHKSRHNALLERLGLRYEPLEEKRTA